MSVVDEFFTVFHVCVSVEDKFSDSIPSMCLLWMLSMLHACVCCVCCLWMFSMLHACVCCVCCLCYMHVFAVVVVVVELPQAPEDDPQKR